MKKVYKKWSVIKLRSGEEITTEITETEYSWHDTIEISDSDIAADFPKAIKIGKTQQLVIKPSDILYIINHSLTKEVEDDELGE